MVEDVLRERTSVMAPVSEADRGPAGVREYGAAQDTLDRLLAYRESVFRICLGFSRNYAEAEDLAQDVYLKAYRKMAALKDPARSKEWLFRIAKNACLDKTKSYRIRDGLLRRWASSGTQNDGTDSAGSADDRIIALKAAVRGLPKTLRSAFVLRLYGRLSYDEIAAALRIPRGTVMSRLNRARVRIADALREKNP